MFYICSYFLLRENRSLTLSIGFGADPRGLGRTGQDFPGPGLAADPVCAGSRFALDKTLKIKRDSSNVDKGRRMSTFAAFSAGPDIETVNCFNGLLAKQGVLASHGSCPAQASFSA